MLRKSLDISLFLLLPQTLLNLQENANIQVSGIKTHPTQQQNQQNDAFPHQ